MFANLIQFNYIDPNGKVNNRYSTESQNIQVRALLDSGNPNVYTIYSWLGTYDRRIGLASGDYCNGGTLTYIVGGTSTQKTFTMSTDITNSWCITQIQKPASGFYDFSNSTLAISHSGTNYQNTLGIWPWPSINMLNTYFPVDPILSASNRGAIFSLLAVALHKTSLIDLINFYPQLLATKKSTTTELNSAKTAMIGMINSYLNLSSYLRGRDSAQGVNYAISMWQGSNGQSINTTKYQKDKSLYTDDETALRQFLTDIKNNLSNPNQYKYVTLPNAKLFNTLPYVGWKMNFSGIFNGNRNDRTYVNKFNAALSKYKILPNNFYDPTISGIYPSAKVEDINFLLGKGVRINSAILSKTPSQITLNWSSYTQSVSQYITGYVLYRGTSPQVDRISGTFIANLPAQSNGYIDTSFNPTTSVYYYSLYTNYKFDDGTLATTYTNAFKITLIPPVQNQVPVVFQIPSQSVTAGKALTVLVTAVDPNTNPSALTITAQLSDGRSLSAIGAAFSTIGTTGSVTTARFTWNKSQYISGGVVSIIITAKNTQGLSTTTLMIINVKKV